MINYPIKLLKIISKNNIQFNEIDIVFYNHNSFFEFLKLKSNTNFYEYSNLDFGVIVKFQNYTTGIVWSKRFCDFRSNLTFTCQPYLNSIQIEMKNFECWYKVVVDNFTFEIVNELFTRNLLFSDFGLKDTFEIDNLIPFTNYTVNLSMFSSKLNISSISKNIFTLENFSSPLTKLLIVSRSRNSIKIGWEPPKYVNLSNILYFIKFNGNLYSTKNTYFEFFSLNCNIIYEFFVTYKGQKNIISSSKLIGSTEPCEYCEFPFY